MHATEAPQDPSVEQEHQRRADDQSGQQHLKPGGDRQGPRLVVHFPGQVQVITDCP